MTLTALRRAALALALLAVLSGLAAPAQAGVLRYCDTPTALGHGQRDRLFRFAGIVRDELEGSGQRLALVSRSGLDLSRFDMRYSHAGVSLKANAVAPWSVRQLYYDCEEHRPRIFDQGLTAFLLGMSDDNGGYLSVVLLPEGAANALEPAALDDRLALRLLAGTYSANAYVWGRQYQNCNQWVAELLASAWGGSDPEGDSRAQAQAWLRAQGYEASTFRVPFAPLMWAVALTPWLHHSDHPSEDLQQALYRVSMPASIEAFVQARLPAAQRIEFCRSGARVVVRRGWAPIAEGCEPGPQDRVVMLD